MVGDTGFEPVTHTVCWLDEKKRKRRK